jgi:hypothetical protein
MSVPVAFMTPEQREKQRAKAQAYRAANPEKWLAWNAHNPEKHRAAVRAWNAANPDKARARVRAYKESKRRARMTLTLLAIGGAK